MGHMRQLVLLCLVLNCMEIKTEPVVPYHPQRAHLSHLTLPKDTQRYNMRTHTSKHTRSSSRTRKVINYAQLNDGLCDDNDYSPPRKKSKSTAPGQYLSSQRICSHNVQKWWHSSHEETEIDLKEIMNEVEHTVPDLVANKRTPSALNKMDVPFGNTPKLSVPWRVTQSFC